MAVKSIDDLTFDELKEQYLKERDAMFARLKELDEKVARLEKQVKDDVVNINDLSLRLRISEEKYRMVVSAKYQSQNSKVVLNMPTLFDDVEEEAMKVAEEEVQETIEVAGHKRVRRPKEKHIDYSALEHEVETLSVPDGEDICPECGSKMHIKKYEEKEELVVIPARVFVRVTRIPVLECVECQSKNEEGKSTYVTVSHKGPVFSGSKVSPELLAHIIDLKYNEGLPLHAIEQKFARNNVILPKQNMCNWVIGSMKYLEPIYNRMKLDLLQKKIIQSDETPTQCLNEEGKPATSTSYMWIHRSGPYDKPIVLYDYRDSRSGECAKEFLKGFNAFHIHDAYSGYNKVEGVISCLCNVHALRKFKDAYKLLPNTKERKNSDEAKAIKKYDEIFQKEHQIQEAAVKKYSDLEKRLVYIQKRRENEIKPMFESFLVWLEEIKAANLGRYGMSKAIEYTLKNSEGLMRFIENGEIPLDNNASERSVRPFVVIRGRCKFHVSTKGAHASAIIYSIVITCMENGINPYMYLYYLFDELRGKDSFSDEEIERLLPYSDRLPSYTKILSKKEIKAILKEASE